MRIKNRNGWRMIAFLCSITLLYGFSVDAFAAQINHAPKIAGEFVSESEESEVIVDSSFCMDLTKLFIDEDGDELTFYAKLEDKEYRKIEKNCQFFAEDDDTLRITFKASDGMAESEEFRVLVISEQNTGVLNTSEISEQERNLNEQLLGEQPQELEAQWANFRNSDCNMAITNVSLPRNEEASIVTAKWIQNYMTGNSHPSVPIMVEDSLVIMSGTTLYKLDKDTGEVVQKATMAAAPNFGVVPPVYGAGMIFCPLANGTIQAFNAKTFAPLWIYHDPLGGQSLSPITYADGYIYTGFWNAERENANFVCIYAADEVTGQTDEEKQAVWSYTHKGGFYWAGSVVVGQAVVVGSDDGSKEGVNGSAKVYSFHKQTGAVISEAALASDSGDQRSSIAYDKISGKIYFTTKGGYLYSANVDVNTGKISSLKGKKYDGASTSTPVVYKNRVYFGLGNGFANGAVIAADAETLEEVYRVKLQGYPQNSLLLSTAYEASSGYLYFYSTYNNFPGGISVIKAKADAASQADVQLTELYTPASGYDQYCIASLICDKDGTIYYKNDTGNLFAIGISDFENVINLINEIGAVTLESEGKIKTAREAYDSLSSAEKRKVTNIDLLVAAEKELADLKRQRAFEEWMEWWKKNILNLQKSKEDEANKVPVKESGTITSNNLTGNKNSTVKTTTSVVSGQSSKQTVSKTTALQFKDELEKVTKDTSYETSIKLLMTWTSLSDKEQLAFTDSEELVMLQEIAAKKHHQDADTGIQILDVPWNICIQISEPQNEAIKEGISAKYTEGSILNLWNIYLEDILTKETYQPETPVEILIPIKLLENGYSYDSFRILHYRNDRTIEILNCEVSGEYLTFHAVDFSYYAVIGMEKTNETELPAESVEMQTDEKEGSSWILWAALAGIGIGAVEILIYFMMKEKTDERKKAQTNAENNE